MIQPVIIFKIPPSPPLPKGGVHGHWCRDGSRDGCGATTRGDNNEIDVLLDRIIRAISLTTGAENRQGEALKVPLWQRGIQGDLRNRGGFMLEYSRNLKDPARELRATMTEAEQLLWSRLRRKQILGVPFYRQKPIGAYTVDFYAPSAKLVIEVDGSQHGTVEHRKRDLEKDRSLAEMGLKVMRFDNLDLSLQ